MLGVLFLLINIFIIFLSIWEIMFIYLYIFIIYFFIRDGFRIFNFFYRDLLSYIIVGLRFWLRYLIILTVFRLNLSEDFLFKFLNTNILFFLYLTFFIENLFYFYLFFEVVLIPIFLIIFIWGNQPERLRRRIYIFLYTLFGSLPLLLIILYLLKYNRLSFLYWFIGVDKIEVSFWVFFVLNIAFLVKFPIYGFHLWLPKAHVEAPIFGSIILAGVLLKLGGYGIYRFMVFYQNYRDFILFNLIISVSLIGGIFVGLICLRQVDVKILIAYSSVVHMRLIIVGEFSINLFGRWGSLLIMIGHGVCSSGLFCLANFIYERFFTRNMMVLKGMNRLFPSLRLLWFLLIVINIGAPPFMNLFGEVILIGSNIKYSLILLFPILFISFFRACYSLYFFRFTQHGKIWFLYGINIITIREYILILFHLIPLLLFLLKIEIFFIWVYLSSLYKIINCGFIEEFSLNN